MLSPPSYVWSMLPIKDHLSVRKAALPVIFCEEALGECLSSRDKADLLIPSSIASWRSS